MERARLGAAIVLHVEVAWSGGPLVMWRAWLELGTAVVGGGVIDIEVRSEGRSGRKRAGGGLNDDVWRVRENA